MRIAQDIANIKASQRQLGYLSHSQGAYLTNANANINDFLRIDFDAAKKKADARLHASTPGLLSEVGSAVRAEEQASLPHWRLGRSLDHKDTFYVRDAFRTFAVPGDEKAAITPEALVRHCRVTERWQVARIICFCNFLHAAATMLRGAQQEALKLRSARQQAEQMRSSDSTSSDCGDVQPGCTDFASLRVYIADRGGHTDREKLGGICDCNEQEFGQWFIDPDNSSAAWALYSAFMWKHAKGSGSGGSRGPQQKMQAAMLDMCAGAATGAGLVCNEEISDEDMVYAAHAQATSLIYMRNYDAHLLMPKGAMSKELIRAALHGEDRHNTIEILSFEYADKKAEEDPKNKWMRSCCLPASILSLLSGPSAFGSSRHPDLRSRGSEVSMLKSRVSELEHKLENALQQKEHFKKLHSKARKRKHADEDAEEAKEQKKRHEKIRLWQRASDTRAAIQAEGEPTEVAVFIGKRKYQLEQYLQLYYSETERQASRGTRESLLSRCRAGFERNKTRPRVVLPPPSPPSPSPPAGFGLLQQRWGNVVANGSVELPPLPPYLEAGIAETQAQFNAARIAQPAAAGVQEQRPPTPVRVQVQLLTFLAQHNNGTRRTDDRDFESYTHFGASSNQQQGSDSEVAGEVVTTVSHPGRVAINDSSDDESVDESD